MILGASLWQRLAGLACGRDASMVDASAERVDRRRAPATHFDNRFRPAAKARRPRTCGAVGVDDIRARHDAADDRARAAIGVVVRSHDFGHLISAVCLGLRQAFAASR
jgi:hypothetical protein